jgi:alkanesulfonate monooxygenase SsuD/methylene tetrahydromethanopterin reductase-like flavin-dependent oxidoreductase (luciferase family)
MRKIFAREAPVSHQGREISLPYKGAGAMGVGKPLKSILRCRPGIPIYLGTGNEAMMKLTAEIADGWLPLGFVPGSLPEYMPWLEEGFRRAGSGKSLRNFGIQAHAHAEVNEDVKAALVKLKPEVALYVGRMGRRDKNFHKDMLIRRGSLGTRPSAFRALSRRGGTGRMGRSESARWPMQAHHRALPSLGGFRHHRLQRPLK